jgi:hypothetical protein
MVAITVHLQEQKKFQILVTPVLSIMDHGKSQFVEILLCSNTIVPPTFYTK